MPFYENSEATLFYKYSPETFGSESVSKFSKLRPETIERSQQLLLKHSESTMTVDVEALLFFETPQ